MLKYEGEYGVEGKLAYVEQLPFIFADTFQKNILFGHEMNQERYNQVIHFCAL